MNQEQSLQTVAFEQCVEELWLVKHVVRACHDGQAGSTSSLPVSGYLISQQARR